MPLNKLDNFIKNTEGRILYVSPADLDSTDSIDNKGNSLARPFKTIQRALIEAARFSYLKGNNNDEVEKTTILLMPGNHEVDNRPGWQIYNSNGVKVLRPDSSNEELVGSTLDLTLQTNFDLTQENNDLYKFNSVHGGVIVPRGTSIVGLDLRKTKIRPKYVPNPTDSSVPSSSIFRITGACYFWQFSFFDGDEFGEVYTNNKDFSSTRLSSPAFSHHKLSCFEYADGVNEYQNRGLTDLQMYYAKLSIAYGSGSGRDIDANFPDVQGFAPQRPEYEIVGAFDEDPIQIQSIDSGSPVGSGIPSQKVTVTTKKPHGLSKGTPIKIRGSAESAYNVSTKVSDVSTSNPNVFTYNILSDPSSISAEPELNNATVTIETDTVDGASPYIFNISMRSVWGMQGMHADGSKATGFRSMVVAQFTGVSLQKDDRAFVKYNEETREYEGLDVSTVNGTSIAQGASSLNDNTVYHLDSDAIYRRGWETNHIRITNDAIMQIVSVFAIGYGRHFTTESGGDASITNSNSNFGQLSLVSSGFKKEAFDKDNNAFITHVINPRAIVSQEEEIGWLTINADAANTTTKLYLSGFSNLAEKPPILTQGYRVGAKLNDELYLKIGNTEYSAKILMHTHDVSSEKVYSIDQPVYSTGLFTISNSGTHDLQNEEKVIILSKDGDLPENLETNKVYYIIRVDSNSFKLASSKAEASSGKYITVSGGTNLTIKSRVSDKNPGDPGHPVQFDNGWYINVDSSNTIYSNLPASGITDSTYIKRKEDTRSLDEKLYKLRVVIPRELPNAKTPENGFIIQESSSTGVRGLDDTDFGLTSISTSDYDYHRNLSLIANCERDNSTVTVTSEQPHNLRTNDIVIIRNVKDSTINTSIGTFNKGYNGTFTVGNVVDSMTFTYETEATPGSYSNDLGIRSDTSPRFERRNSQSNSYIYRNEIIQEYIDGNQDGIYHLYVLNSNNAVSEEFVDTKYSQNVVDLYPQLDRDNVDDNPPPSRSFALRSPIGDVSTSDLKKSLTKESLDEFAIDFGVANTINSLLNQNTTTADITFNRRHNFNGVIKLGSITQGTGTRTEGVYKNVKLFSDNALSIWKGATADIEVNSSNQILTGTGQNIVRSTGSGYQPGETLWYDNTNIGGNSDATTSVVTDNIGRGVGLTLQFTGSTTTPDTYHRITAVGNDTTVSIARTTGDTVITEDQYALVVSPSIQISSYSYGNGNTTIHTSTAHGLVENRKVRIIDSSNNYQGDFLVKTIIDSDSFVISGQTSNIANGYVLEHGFSSSNQISNKNEENLNIRSHRFSGNEIASLVNAITSSDTTFAISHAYTDISTVLDRLGGLGGYIQIDEEIMRISSSSLSGTNSNEITVIRGALATEATSHSANDLIERIKPISIEFRRPSIIRASGHTFEYLGYGPGNYSTGLPQVQVKTISEKEEFLSQSQERSSGVVVYTGMNNKGDFYIGNQKKSSATGEETTFDTPVATITGEDVSRLSAVFDEVTIKERIVVEGGESNLILSQFDGPVTFTGTIISKNQVKITKDTDSDSVNSGALVVTGGVGVSKTVTATSVAAGTVRLDAENNQITTDSGDLNINCATGSKISVKTNTEINGNLNVTGDITAFYSPSDERWKDNIEPIQNSLNKVIGISGNTFTWNEKSQQPTGMTDIGVIAQEVHTVLPEAVLDRGDHMSVNYQKLIPLLIEAIKDLNNKIDDLEERIDQRLNN